MITQRPIDKLAQIQPFVTRLLVGLLALWFFTPVAQAHFVFDAQTRVIHVEAQDDGTHVFIRFPLPLAYAEALAKRRNGQDRVRGPFLEIEMVGTTSFYQLDFAQISKSPDSFTRFLAQGYAFSVDGQMVEADAIRVAVHDNHDRVPAITNLEEMHAAIATGIPEDGQTYYIGDTLVDIELRLPVTANTGTLSIHNVLPAFTVPEGMLFDNLILDHRFGIPRLTKIAGLMQEPAVLTGSWLNVFLGFVHEGIAHIFFGPDHVLFVLCMALAASGYRSLLWSVSGFTLGHTLTLGMGSLGLAPQGAWFPPTIEIAIALSIIYVGVQALRRERTDHIFIGTVLIGLMHGYGLSFLLTDMLDGAGGNFISAILAFNIGVEIAQLAIVALVLIVLWVLGQISHKSVTATRIGLAAFSIAIALAWGGERSLILFRQLGGGTA